MVSPDHFVKGGRTPLHQASYYGHSNVASLLLNNGADPHLKDTVTLQTLPSL
jgi:ankyrin repeat protein